MILHYQTIQMPGKVDPSAWPLQLLGWERSDSEIRMVLNDTPKQALDN